LGFSIPFLLFPRIVGTRITTVAFRPRLGARPLWLVPLQGRALPSLVLGFLSLAPMVWQQTHFARSAIAKSIMQNSTFALANRR
jgi:hypothetical protein